MPQRSKALARNWMPLKPTAATSSIAFGSSPPQVMAAYPSFIGVASAFMRNASGEAASKDRNSRRFNSDMRLHLLGVAARKHGDRHRAGQRDDNQKEEAGAVAARVIAQVADQHGRRRFGDAVRGED